MGGFKIFNFNIFGGFSKNEYFWGYEDLEDTNMDYIKGSFLCILGYFLNPFMPNGISHHYQFDESISNMRVFW